MTHESSNEQRGNFSPWLFFTPCTSVKCQKTQEGLVLFGCQPGFRVYISRLLTDPSCTQIGQVLLVFFLALQWLPSPSNGFLGSGNITLDRLLLSFQSDAETELKSFRTLSHTDQQSIKKITKITLSDSFDTLICFPNP